MLDKVSYLLLQVRNSNDPMRSQEIDCFVEALSTSPSRIATFDLLQGVPSRARVDRADVVLLGGSGDYSVAAGGPWLSAALEAMRELFEWGKPTFASCWGFQAMAKALGGEVETDVGRAELGTHHVHLTPAGQDDPVFAPLGKTFLAQMGHQDHVTRLPDVATRLAYTDQSPNQAFHIDGKPLYCTQFHPELSRTRLLERLQAYPKYIQVIAGLTMEEFERRAKDARETQAILRRFVEHVL